MLNTKSTGGILKEYHHENCYWKNSYHIRTVNLTLSCGMNWSTRVIWFRVKRISDYRDLLDVSFYLSVDQPSLTLRLPWWTFSERYPLPGFMVDFLSAVLDRAVPAGNTCQRMQRLDDKISENYEREPLLLFSAPTEDVQC